LVRVIITELPLIKGNDWRLILVVREVPSYKVRYQSSDPSYLIAASDSTTKFDMPTESTALLLSSDVLIEFHQQYEPRRTKLLCSFYFHTSFIDGNTLFLSKHDVDSLKENERFYLEFSDAFRINLIFSDRIPLESHAGDDKVVVANQFYSRALRHRQGLAPAAAAASVSVASSSRTTASSSPPAAPYSPLGYERIE